MTEQIIPERIIELALVRTLPEKYLPKIENSHLKSLYAQLLREIDKDLSKLPTPSPLESQKISRRIKLFCINTGWLDNLYQTGAMISFCQHLIKNSPFPHNIKILSILDELIFHLENTGEFKTECSWTDSIVEEKWKNYNK